jgi:hypothetical protein
MDMKYYLIVIDNSYDGGGDIIPFDHPPPIDELRKYGKVASNMWCVIAGEIIERSEHFLLDEGGTITNQELHEFSDDQARDEEADLH